MGEGQGGGEPHMGEDLLGMAKALRKRQTDAENLLWRHLRAKQLEGVKFRRQAPLGNYIVDFVSFERKIIIEIDGGHHALQEEKDLAREEWLKTQGFKIFRFWNNQVLKELDGVIEVIRKNL
jgi:very-short-patch-repair endonuclease